MPHFDRYLGIDYSGAQTPASSLPGLRVYGVENPVLPKVCVQVLCARKMVRRQASRRASADRVYHAAGDAESASKWEKVLAGK